MNKVLLIDDEILSIEYLKSLQVWEKFNCKVIGYALTVEKAVKLFAYERPEIVFIDVRMPKMDGLELSRKLLDIYPDTNVVIMTAYQEFDYVKEAIQIGIKYFLVKHEINEKKLSEVLNKIEADIYSKQYLNNIIWNNWLHSIWENVGEEDIERAGQPQLNSTYFFTVMNLRSFSIMMGETEEIYLKEEWIRKINISEIKIKAFSRLGKYTYGIVTEYKKSVSESRIYEKILEYIRILEEICKSNVYSSSTFFISDFFCEQTEFVLKCREAKQFAESILWNRQRILTEAEFKNYHEFSPENREDEKETFCGKKDLICFYIEKGRKEKWYVNSKKLSFIKNIVDRLNSEEYLKQEDKRNTVICIEQILQGCLRFMTEKVEGNNSIDKRRDSRAERAAQYIKAHFSEDLSSTILAEKLNVSDGYLRYVFKQKYGCTIKEYILTCRVDMAMELLMEKNSKIYEVARQCGFTSSQHFCRVFRQTTGISPGEYKHNKEQSP